MKSRKGIIALICVAALAAAMAAVYFNFSERSSLGEKHITVIVDHVSGEDREIVFDTDAEYLRTALEELDLIEGIETEYGLWIETVDGETADASKQMWWRIDVNGEMGAYGVDSQPVSDGDIYELTLCEGY